MATVERDYMAMMPRMQRSPRAPRAVVPPTAQPAWLDDELEPPPLDRRAESRRVMLERTALSTAKVEALLGGSSRSGSTSGDDTVRDAHIMLLDLYDAYLDGVTDTRVLEEISGRRAMPYPIRSPCRPQQQPCSPSSESTAPSSRDGMENQADDTAPCSLDDDMRLGYCEKTSVGPLQTNVEMSGAIALQSVDKRPMQEPGDSMVKVVDRKSLVGGKKYRPRAYRITSLLDGFIFSRELGS